MMGNSVSGTSDGIVRRNLQEIAGKKLFRFSGVVIRVSKFSMMSLKDRRSVSLNCGSGSASG